MSIPTHRSSHLWTCLVILLLLLRGALADVHYVAPLTVPKPPYTNWTDAATNIQDALNVATSGDTLLVTDGVWYVTSEIAVTQNIAIASVNGPLATAIDAARNCRVLFLNAMGAMVHGFTIRAGSPGPGSREPWVGGGVYAVNGTLEDCIVSNCSAYSAGGIACDAGAIVRRCVIVNNHGQNDSGGAACWGGRIDRCVIKDNTVGISGNVGGASCNGTGLIENTLFTANDGPGVFLFLGGTVLNCTVTANREGQGRGGVACDNGGLVRNTIIYANEGSNYTNAGSGWSYDFCCTLPAVPGTGNITNAPQLTPSYRLKSISPCIDVGTDSNAPPTDIDGEARWDDPWHSNAVSIVDIGADEFVDTDLDSMADHWETAEFGNITDRDGTTDADNDALKDLDEYENSTAPTNSDSDTDGMPDGWEVIHALNPLADDAKGDPDSDGMNNRGEYFSGTDPHSASSVLRFFDVGKQSNGFLISWQTVFGKGYWVERSTNMSLGVWTDVWPSAIYELDEFPEGSESVLDLNVPTNSPAFYKILLE